LLLGLHGGVLLIGALWLTKQHNNWSLRRHWPRNRGPAPGTEAAP